MRLAELATGAGEPERDTSTGRHRKEKAGGHSCRLPEVRRRRNTYTQKQQCHIAMTGK